MSVSYFNSECSQWFHAIALTVGIQTVVRCSSKSTSQLLREAAVPAEALCATGDVIARDADVNTERREERAGCAD